MAKKDFPCLRYHKLPSLYCDKPLSLDLRRISCYIKRWSRACVAGMDRSTQAKIIIGTVNILIDIMSQLLLPQKEVKINF